MDRMDADAIMSGDALRETVAAAGCVLAGGKSLRMGTDKALLRIDGKTLIELALERFIGFPEILVSAADAEHYAFTNVTIIPDERPGIGPLGGIISALKAANSPLVCFRPVDAPLVPSALHTLLAAACSYKDATVPLYRGRPEPLLAAACSDKDAAVPVYKGRPEPLLACFSKTALPVLEELAQSGSYKTAAVFPLLNTAYMQLESPELLDRLGNPESYLINANNPDTFTALCALLRSASPSGCPG